jgi:hypothetical protein
MLLFKWLCFVFSSRSSARKSAAKKTNLFLKAPSGDSASKTTDGRRIKRKLHADQVGSSVEQRLEQRLQRINRESCSVNTLQDSLLMRCSRCLFQIPG